MGSTKYSCSVIEKFCLDAFEKIGFTSSQSRIITDVLLMSDIYGIESHGVQRLVRYHKGIQKGMIKVDAVPETLFETPVTAVIDAHEGMGQLVGNAAMDKAIEKAQTSGIGIVSVRNSNHYGIAGYYAKKASDKGLIGLSMTNSEAIMVPTNGRLAMLGSNPIAIAMPAKPIPFLFDASTTVVTRGKLELYNKMGKPLPEQWALDEHGNATTDASRVLENIVSKKGGGIMPLGGISEESGSHKGYGYAMICELFTSILSMGLTSNKAMQNNHGGICHAFIAINPSFFGDPDLIFDHMSVFLNELRDSPKADGKARIYTHGEKEMEARQDRL
ncbi:MAG: Ldh family oxidoreductase, partial [Clostridiales bacterium]|nr:Ldh family oxidoreductase [Clostridiales bacterium]